MEETIIIDGEEYRKVAEWKSKRVNAIITGYKPVLTPEEYERRHKIAEKGLIDFYKSVVAAGLDWDELCSRNAREVDLSEEESGVVRA